mgnify:CR=1 FL=1
MPDGTNPYLRENFQRNYVQNELKKIDEEDLIPEIMPRHFEEAVRNARRSVSDRDLAQYSSFAVNLQQARGTMTASGGSLGNFAFPASRDGALAATTVDAAAISAENPKLGVR